ncbi:MAG: hypothetical protein QM760_15770 [Nibricoccus sp.]
MKRLVQALLLCIAGQVYASIYINWGMPAQVQSGTSYWAGVGAYYTNNGGGSDGQTWFSLYKDGTYFGSGSGGSTAYFSQSTVDYGDKTVDYYVDAIAYSWEFGPEPLAEHFYLRILPPNPPTAAISADAASFRAHQSTTIRASFSADSVHGDSLVGYNIDYPLGTPAPNQTEPASAHRDFVFVPTSLGLQTFYARIQTAYHGWGTYGTVTVNVLDEPPSQTFTAPSLANVGEAINLSLSLSDPTQLTGYQMGMYVYEKRERLLVTGEYVVTSDNLLVCRQEPAAGDRAWSGVRAAPSEPGRITYTYSSWDQWSSSEGINQRIFVVNVPNHSPSVTISPAAAQALFYGQTLTFSPSASDTDNNLLSIKWKFRTPGGAWSIVPHVSADILVPLEVGTWAVQYEAVDTLNQSASSAEVLVNVAKSSPDGTFSNRSVIEGTGLPSSYLNATFKNRYNSALSAPGSPSYKIIQGGVSPYANGTILQGGEILPAGSYIVEASIPASTCYTDGSVSASFTVAANPSADNDSDGVTNGVEAELGTNPNAGAQKDPDALKLKINTPRP